MKTIFAAGCALAGMTTIAGPVAGLRCMRPADDVAMPVPAEPDAAAPPLAREPLFR